MMLACFTFALWPFHTINLKGIMALGRSDVFLKLEIIKKSLSLIVILSCFRLGVLTWMAVSAFVLGPLGVIINSWPNRKLLDYTIGMQLRDVFPTALICCAQAALMIGVGCLAEIAGSRLNLPSSSVAYLAFLSVKLVLQGLAGMALFFALAYFFRLNPMGEYVHMASTAIGGSFPHFTEILKRRFRD